MRNANNPSRGWGSIYTLAERRTNSNRKASKILIGNGSDMSVKDYGARKSKKKIITQALVLRMKDIAEKDGRGDVVKSLWNTYHCQNKVYTYEGRLYCSYCKNRFCTTCLGIRKAEIIRKYYPVLKEWEDAHFVTLTVKSCTKRDLNLMMKKCKEGLQKVIDRNRKHVERGKGRKLKCIYSIECNFNPERYWYNPHIHLIVPDKETAEILIDEWLKQWTYKKSNKKPLANKKGQDMRKVNALEGALKEVIKYGTKVFTDPTEKKKGKRSVNIYARAFYNIIVAMKGLRLFGSVGFTLPKETENKQPAIVTEEYKEWHYLSMYADWQDIESELTLFGCMPDDVLRELLENHIDIESE